MPLTYDASMFRYNPDERIFTAEASDLKWPPGFAPDAVRLRNKTTGKIAEFHYATTNKNGDDVTCWCYTCGLHKCELYVFND